VYSGFRYAWVMLTASGNYRWAQLGPYQAPSGVRHETIQYINSSLSTLVEVDLPPLSIGFAPPTWVNYNSSTHKVDFVLNATVVHTSSYALNWTPMAGQMNGEITTLINQMMGQVGNHDSFSDNRIKYGGVLHTYAGTAIFNSQFFNQAGTAPNFDIWDKTCTP